jgi:hypothetical protein
MTIRHTPSRLTDAYGRAADRTLLEALGIEDDASDGTGDGDIPAGCRARVASFSQIAFVLPANANLLYAG